MNRNQVLPQVELSSDLNALRRVDFCAPQSYKGAGFLKIAVLPRLAEEAAAIESGDGFHWEISTHFMDSPGAESPQVLTLGLKGRMHLICQRCLKECAQDLSETRQFVMVATEALADTYPMEDDQCEPIVASQHFDLLGLIEDEILLSLPLIPKHTDGTCQAPAAVFGGSEEGGGTSQKPENPFNILKNMKKN